MALMGVHALTQARDKTNPMYIWSFQEYALASFSSTLMHTRSRRILPTGRGKLFSPKLALSFHGFSSQNSSNSLNSPDAPRLSVLTLILHSQVILHPHSPLTTSTSIPYLPSLLCTYPDLPHCPSRSTPSTNIRDYPSPISPPVPSPDAVLP